MAQITRAQVPASRTAPARTVTTTARQAVPARTAQPAARAVAAKPTPGVREVAGFKIVKGVEIPPKKAFGGKKGVFNELFSQMENGDYIEVPVDEGKKNTSKMNSLYNAARRNGVEITIRIQDNGADGTGGTLGVWFIGVKGQA